MSKRKYSKPVCPKCGESESEQPEPQPAHKWLVVHSGPDKNGRYVYTVYWWADYHPDDPAGENRLAERAQVFNAPLPDWYIAAQSGPPKSTEIIWDKVVGR